MDVAVDLEAGNLGVEHGVVLRVALSFKWDLVDGTDRGDAVAGVDDEAP